MFIANFSSISAISWCENHNNIN